MEVKDFKKILTQLHLLQANLRACSDFDSSLILDKEVKAHLTIYTREYLLILIICFRCVVFLFLYIYFMIWDNLFFWGYCG